MADRQLTLVECLTADLLMFDGDLITSQSQRFGAHTRPEIAVVTDRLQAGDTAIDVGAHVGTFTIPMAHAVGDTGTVLAVEADPDNAELLAMNVTLNQVRNTVHVHRGGVGHDDQTGSMRFPGDANTGAAFFTGEVGGDVQVRPLDKIVDDLGLGPVALVKIDVEGMELDALRGGIELLRRDRPVLYIEIAPELLARRGHSASEVEGLLSDLGYTFLQNAGPRNVASDDYELVDVPSFAATDPLFDVLCLPGEASP